MNLLAITVPSHAGLYLTSMVTDTGKLEFFLFKNINILITIELTEY